jgi:hypothetical protein
MREGIPGFYEGFLQRLVPASLKTKNDYDTKK